MRRPAGRIVLAAVCCLGLLAGVTHAWVVKLVHSPEFTARAEEELGRLLGAGVRIGHVRVRLFNRISLESLVVQTPGGGEAPLLMQVERIDFRYSLFELLFRRMAVPSGLSFEQPRIDLNETDLLRGLFAGAQPLRASGLRELRLSGGEMTYRLPSAAGVLHLTEAEGVVAPGGEDRPVRIRLEANARGLVDGRIRIEGTWGVRDEDRRLRVFVQDLSPGDSIPVPFEAASGEALVHTRGVDLVNFDAGLHGWRLGLSGSFRGGKAGPVFEGRLRLGEGEDTGRMHFRADFGAEQFSGELALPQREAVSFEGRLGLDGSRIRFEDLKTKGNVGGEGTLDFRSGDYRFHFEKGRQRVTLVSNLRGLDFRLEADLNHLKVFGIDLVTRASIRLKPVSPVFEDRPWHFTGEIETDYLILERMPFEDFTADFEAGPFGLRDVRAAWGGSFTAEGGLKVLPEGAAAKVSVAVRDFDLALVREFWNRPLPGAFGGRVDGKLTIEGDVRRPEVTGHFRVRDGAFGRLDYDSGIIRFRGFFPYLPLEESRIMRGRLSLDLVGAIDFSLDNMFYGIRVQTGDKLVLWKGWALNTSAEEGDIEIDPSLGTLPLIRVFVAQDAAGGPASNQDVFQEEGYVGAGPKLKF